MHLSAQHRKVGAVYMAGYAVECALKAYLQYKGIARPSGLQGHNLSGLLKAAQLSFGDVPQGSFFFQYWTVDLRYEHALPPDWGDVGERIIEARMVVGRISTWIKREEKRKRK